jgi:hypothetical protein
MKCISHMYYDHITQKFKKAFSLSHFSPLPQERLHKAEIFYHHKKTQQIITATVQSASKNGIMFASHSPS